MTERTSKWREFHDYLEFLTHAAKFKFIQDAQQEVREAGQQAISPQESLLACYENHGGNSLRDCIWVTDKALHWNSANGVIHMPYADVKIRLAFEDIRDAEKDLDLRAVIVTLPNEHTFKMPVLGVTDGDFDVVRIKPLVFRARDAMGLVHSVTGSEGGLNEDQK